MPVRAIIISIEDYSSPELAPHLSGTNQGAASFRDWLISKKQVNPSNILCCANASCLQPTVGTTRREIKDMIYKLWIDGKDTTDELYFFFSGHGFSYTGMPNSNDKTPEILLASDYYMRGSSGDACLNLREIQRILWNSLGPGHHYYFVDACRTLIGATEITPSSLGITLNPPSDLGNDTYYTLFSTALGQTSRVVSGFTPILVQGLSGGGKAKEWRSTHLWVTFDRLREYLQQRILNQEIDSDRNGNGLGLILELSPIPKSQCEIIIDNAGRADSFILTVSTITGINQQFPFKGNFYRRDLRPDDYFLDVSHRKVPVTRIDPPPPDPVDLYDSCAVRFKKGTPPLIPQQPLSPGPVATHMILEGAPHTRIELENPQTGTIISNMERFEGEVEPGTYLLKMREHGISIYEQKLTIKPGESKRLNLLECLNGQVRANNLERVLDAAKSELAAFLESRGPIANRDLGLWLSLLGASRIIAPNSFNKSPLRSFRYPSPDESALYVLAGFVRTEGLFHIGMSRNPDVEWNSLKEVDGFPGIYDFRMSTTPGPYLLSMKMPTKVPITMPIHCLPGYVTLIIFVEDVEDKQGYFRTNQFLLPIYPFFQQSFNFYLDPNPLSVLHTMYLAQNHFARKRSIEMEPGSAERRDWENLLNGEWLDPIMSLIAAYELIRRGYVHERRPSLQRIVERLRRSFTGIPDIEIIAKRIGLESRLPETSPLLLDGVLTLEELGSRLPLPPNKLDYGSSWTMWRGAVKSEWE